MPLHLLGKKSWNVYNVANVEKVRRDEAEAQAREDAAEQRMQADDAARRLAILRDEEPPPLPIAEDEVVKASDERTRRPEDGYARKRRKRRGEDDTDQAIRYAREDAEAGEKVRERLVLKHREEERDAPLVDHAGHVQLIAPPDEATVRKAAKNAEAEAEKAKKRKRDEDQYTMRFSNAAGFNTSTHQKPWYAAGSNSRESKAVMLSEVVDKDVWGNEDPRRKEREQNRISSNDPFAAMQQAQRQLKRSETDREKWKRERELEIEQLRRAEERQLREEEKRRQTRRKPDNDADSLDDFSLDAPTGKARDRERSEHDRHRRRHHRRHHGSRMDRSRSRSRQRHRSVGRGSRNEA